MRYWFTIRGFVPEESAQKLWSRIKQYKANITVLSDKVYVYGSANPDIIKLIENELMEVIKPFQNKVTLINKVS